MKGVILAGGNGTRLMPLTKSVNKHLLPIGNKPMLQHCVDKMTGAGIRDILVVTGGEHLGGIAEFLGSGCRFNCRFTFRVQEEAGGIAQALGLAEGFAEGGKICVILGDNIFKADLASFINTYNIQTCSDNGYRAMVVLKTVKDPQRFGVAVFNKKGVMSGIVEKPNNPPSNLAVTGIYFYDDSVFKIIRTLKPSGRGELEITDVNNEYIRWSRLAHMTMTGWWTDAGTHESYRLANKLVMKEGG